MCYYVKQQSASGVILIMPYNMDVKTLRFLTFMKPYGNLFWKLSLTATAHCTDAYRLSDTCDFFPSRFSRKLHFDKGPNTRERNGKGRSERGRSGHKPVIHPAKQNVIMKYGDYLTGHHLVLQIVHRLLQSHNDDDL